MKSAKKGKIAVWALTPEGLDQASVIVDSLQEADGYGPEHRINADSPFKGFQRLQTRVHSIFHSYEGHVFIMAVGIVVRIIAPLLRGKVRDPAVVVLDEKARHVISLLSGHLGGANALARNIAQVLGGTPVITTATDVHGVKAFDIAAVEKDLWIENPDSIKVLNAALLEKRKIYLIDPMKIISPLYEDNSFIEIHDDFLPVGEDMDKCPSVYIGDRLVAPRAGFLIVRPPSLVAGVGCNRETAFEELKEGFDTILGKFRLSMKSLRNLATIELKRDEECLTKLGEMLDIPIHYFSSKELGSVKNIEHPSQVVKKYTGTEGVCEAAALLSAGAERLLVPKQVLKNVTVAVARVNSTL
jgi:cobalt-precorrin 5A hydrolase